MDLHIAGKISSSNLPRVNSNDEWTVYGANYCPYTKKTIKYLKDNNISHVYHEVEDEDRKTLTERTGGHKTIPAVYNHDKFIGGCDKFFLLIGK